LVFERIKNSRDIPNATLLLEILETKNKMYEEDEK